MGRAIDIVPKVLKDVVSNRNLLMKVLTYDFKGEDLQDFRTLNHFLKSLFY